jgi:glyoxylase-like metal-dependent hydrolase (beta-lactamase superfamily II)
MKSWGSRLAGLDVSAYVVRGVLVDTGMIRARASLATLLRDVKLEGVMITHWHEDHAGNATLLAKRGLPLAMHAYTEARLRERLAIRLYRRVVWGTPLPLQTSHPPFEHPVLRFVHTPGHSPDHQVVWDPERETLFSGDLWLGVRARVLHAGEDPYRIIVSLRDASALAPKRMFDAHRGAVSEPRAALAAKQAFMEDTIALIAAKVAAGWSDRAILREVLGGEDRVGFVSGGEYSRANFVRAVRRQSP